MYTSDHGERAGAHGMRQKAGTMYREETNIPMIIAHPDVKGGRATKGLMGAIDIAPTLMALAGLSADEGRNRFPNLRSEERRVGKEGVSTCRSRWWAIN